MAPLLNLAVLQFMPLDNAAPPPDRDRSAFPLVPTAARPNVRHSLTTSWPDEQDEYSLVAPAAGAAIRVMTTWNAPTMHRPVEQGQ